MCSIDAGTRYILDLSLSEDPPLNVSETSTGWGRIGSKWTAGVI